MQRTDMQAEVRIGGPTSQTMRNIMKQTLKLASEGNLSLIQLQLASGAISDCADQVERLEAMIVPASQRASTMDIERGKVVTLFDETKRLAIGGTVTAPPRRRGFWKRFQNILRRV